MKNLIKSQRGIAIEMAVIAMFLMIALSIVLISISNSQIRYMKNDVEDFNEKVEVYEITDHILKNHKPDETITEYSDSNCVIVGEKIEGTTTNEYEYTVTKNGNMVLTLTIETDSSNKNIITSWGN